MKEQLTQLLIQENNKQHWKHVAQWVLKNDAIDDLIELFLSKEYRTSQRAAAIFMTLVDIDKNIFYPYQELLVDTLLNMPSTTQKRNIYRLFQFIFIKEEVEGKLLDACFTTLETLTEPIAVRVFAMTTAYRIGERYPEVLPELKILIENNIELANSTGLENRGRKIIKKIDTFKNN